MRSVWVAAALALLAGGCASTSEEQAKLLGDDGVFLFQRGAYDPARESFQAALELVPEDANLRYNIGQCYERQGNLDRADQLYRECLQKDPGHGEGRQALAVLMVRRGRRDEAVRLAEEWLTRQPKRAAPYALDGWLWHQAGDLPRAHGRLQQALELDPTDRLALNEMALVYESMRRPDRALTLYERSLEVDPGQREVFQRVSRLRAQGVAPPRPE
jgi:tetratricopeptide (TPR) repeat protein